jgi:hypothetical protein
MNNWYLFAIVHIPYNVSKAKRIDMKFHENDIKKTLFICGKNSRREIFLCFLMSLDKIIHKDLDRKLNRVACDRHFSPGEQRDPQTTHLCTHTQAHCTWIRSQIGFLGWGSKPSPLVCVWGGGGTIGQCYPLNPSYPAQPPALLGVKPDTDCHRVHNGIAWPAPRH